MKKTIIYLLSAIALCNCSTPVAKTELPRDKATHQLDTVWMRDPYIVLSPANNKYYLTYTNGQMEMPVWSSDDLKNWAKLGEDYTMKRLENYDEIYKMREELNKNKTVYYDGKMVKSPNETKEEIKMWAPEIHYIDGSWYAIHTTNSRISIILKSDTPTFSEFEAPFTEDFGMHHDPYIFQDDNGDNWLVDKCAEIIKFNKTMSGFEGEAIKLDPANRKMGHEGCQIVKIGNKYVWFGTAWSCDRKRNGTYNLYYATADKIEGPYSDRRFAGRCLGHGTLFQDKAGEWWCTAFYNGEKYVNPSKVVAEGVDTTYATTMNRQGLTIVPMSIKLVDGDVMVKALDPNYERPGAEEAQQF